MIDARVKEGWKGLETDLQIMVVNQTLLLIHEFPELGLLYAVPNGDFRGFATGKKLKAEGLKSGVPDLCLPVPRYPYHGFYLELKAKKNGPSEEQWAFMGALKEMGYFVRVTNCPNVAVRLLREYLTIDESELNSEIL